MSMFKVQSPEKDIFCSQDLEWKDDVAYIPTNRLHQFLAGEELGSGTAPTKFKIMSSRTRKEGSLQVHRIRPECWLKYTRYWCTYGPKDHRNMSGGEKSGSPDCASESIGSQGRTGGAASIKRQSSARGEDFARGCTCHFNVKVMYLWPSITQINYVHKSHKDASGSICHGSLDPSAVGSKAQFAPRLSMDMRRWVLYLLSRNIPPKQILHEHQLLIQEKRSKNQGYTPVRDDFLNKHDILNISKRLAEETFQMHMSEDESIRIWAQNHQDLVICYQAEDKINGTPFILAIQTPWQKDKLVTLGHQRVVGCSATLGTGRFKYQMFTLLVFDVHQNAIPTAWIVTSSNKTSDIEIWLSRLNRSMNEYLRGWRPSCFIVDTSGCEINAIRNVFHDAPIYLCLWRVRRCWLKHLNRKVQNMNVRSAMFRKLGEIMYLSSEQSLSLCNTETHALKQVDSFLDEFREEISFGCYFRERWLPKMGPWIKATQNIPHTNLDINSAIEGYHANLKARVKQGKETVLGRRIDWLLHTLVKDVESHFWFIDFSKKWGFWHTTHELIIEPSLSQATAIPDCNVTLVVPTNHEVGLSTTSTIVDTKDPGIFYTIYNVDTEWSCCDCDWAQQGNMCKHQMKILIMKGTIGGRVQAAVQNQCDNGNRFYPRDDRICQSSVVSDYELSGRNGAGRGDRMTRMSTDSDFESAIIGNDLDDGFVDNHQIDDPRPDDPNDFTQSGFAKFEKSFINLIDSVSDIDNVIIANCVAGIMTHAVHKISKLKKLTTESASKDIISFEQHHNDEFLNGCRSTSQNPGDGINNSHLKRFRPIVEQVLSRKRPSHRAIGNSMEDPEMQPLIVGLEKGSWLSPFVTNPAIHMNLICNNKKAPISIP